MTINIIYMQIYILGCPESHNGQREFRSLMLK